jgi:predicted nuclease of predicted toxin-antitoxin system
MLRLLMDEDFRGPILAGLRRHYPELDFVRAVDVGLNGIDDDLVLAWAAADGRITVSHDVNTMIDAANRRIEAGQPMSGLILVPQNVATGTAIVEIRQVAELANSSEMLGNTLWLPL